MTPVAPDNSSSFSLPLPLADLIPLMVEEWPDLSREALENVADDPEATVIYIATHTDHTRTLVRRHLGELASLMSTQADDASDDHRPTTLGQRDRPDIVPSGDPPDSTTETTDQSAAGPSTIDQLLGELEDRTDQLIQDFKAEMLPELEKKARSNLGTSLLMAVGLGVILGLLLGGKRG
ncbi:MAG: hypothetical protein ACHWZW_23375 [Spirulina sp.]